MNTTCLLKQEINQTLDSLHDFAKWKLIVVSGLTAVGLGLSTESGPIDSDWMLVFVPFACVYVDLNCYQYLLRIEVISKFLRESTGYQSLKEYEAMCEEFRGHTGAFDLGLFAQVGCSAVFSLILPGTALVRHLVGQAGFSEVALVLGGWIVGLGLVVGCFAVFWYKRGQLKDIDKNRGDKIIHVRAKRKATSNVSSHIRVSTGDNQ